MATLRDLLSALRAAHSNNASISLATVKTTLLKHGLLFPSATSSESDLVTARDVLELAALLSVRARDGTAFERYLAQLGSFWELDLCVNECVGLIGQQTCLVVSRGARRSSAAAPALS